MSSEAPPAPAGAAAVPEAVSAEPKAKAEKFDRGAWMRRASDATDSMIKELEAQGVDKYESGMLSAWARFSSLSTRVYTAKTEQEAREAYDELIGQTTETVRAAAQEVVAARAAGGAASTVPDADMPDTHIQQPRSTLRRLNPNRRRRAMLDDAVEAPPMTPEERRADAVPETPSGPMTPEQQERARTMREALSARSSALNERAKTLGPSAEKFVRGIGERYNKLGWKKKVLIGGTIAAGAVGLSVATGGASIWWTFGILSGYRLVAGAGTFVALEGALQRSNEKAERVWNKYPKAYAATAAALVGTGLVGKGVAAGAQAAFDTIDGSAKLNWLKAHLPGGASTMRPESPAATAALPPPLPDPPLIRADTFPSKMRPIDPMHPEPVGPASVPESAPHVAPTPQPEAPHVPTPMFPEPPPRVVPAPEAAPRAAPMPPVEAPPRAQTPEAVPYAPVAPPEATPSAPLPVAISVEVKSGLGYESMIRDLAGQLKGQNPNLYPADSDAYRLLNAKPERLNNTILKIEQEHGFVNADGSTKKLAGLGTKLSIGPDGKITASSGAPVAEAPPPEPAKKPRVRAPRAAATGTSDRVADALNRKEFVWDDSVATAQLNRAELARIGAGLPIEPTESQLNPKELARVRAMAAQSHVEAPAARPLAGPDTVLPTQGAPRPGGVIGSIAPEAVGQPHIVQASLHEASAPFINEYNVPVDPTKPSVYLVEGNEGNNAAGVYGGTYAEQLETAKAYAKAHKGIEVWIQAEKPIEYQGAPHPWAIPITYRGWPNRFDIPQEMTDPRQIGAVEPKTFKKVLET